MKLQKIDIDFDIYKLIETERKSFEEAPYMALRRLLNLPPPAASDSKATNLFGEGNPFIEDGVSVPHGSRARMKYMRGTQIYEGNFLDGSLEVNGKSYSSLSSAAKDLAITKKGTNPSLNGWLYWEVKYPNETTWHSMHELRKAVQKK